MLLVLSNSLLVLYLYSLMTLNVKKSKEYSCLLCVLYHACIWQLMDLKEKTDLLEWIKLDEMISIIEIMIPYICISSKTNNKFPITYIIVWQRTWDPIAYVWQCSTGRTRRPGCCCSQHWSLDCLTLCRWHHTISMMRREYRWVVWEHWRGRPVPCCSS